MRALCVIAVAGCWTTSTSGAPPQAPAPSRASDLVITEDRFGSLDETSPATLASVREQFPDLDIRPENASTLDYRAFAGSDELFFVVADESFSILDVQATSPRVVSRVHDWRVGSAFRDGRLISKCECWGDNPTCYHRGEHVAVNFDMPCFGAVDARDFSVLDGRAPRRVIWSPKPFGSREIDGVDDVRNIDPADGSDDDDF
ncbi:MAG TPA: hypothetical protein VH143_11725 [Kofleriaceae bacterium]|jgi:hypothetical protein|nr:hypothetical protein [Kofleriaceae bacterium]